MPKAVLDKEKYFPELRMLSAIQRRFMAHTTTVTFLDAPGKELNAKNDTRST